MNKPLNGKILPVLAILLTVALAAATSIAASNYTQGNVEARVTANEKDIAKFDRIVRRIDRALARIEGRTERGR